MDEVKRARLKARGWVETTVDELFGLDEVDRQAVELRVRLARKAENVSGQRAKKRRGMPCRRFTLLDGMILVAGVAVWIWVMREGLVPFLGRNVWKVWIVPVLGCVLISSAGLMLILRLRRPRPPIWRIASQPGAVACFAIVTFAGADMAERFGSNWIEGFPLSRPLFAEMAIMLVCERYMLPCGLVVCWTLLALGHRWRSEPGWIDGLGRALGWSWIAWGLLGSALIVINHFRYRGAGWGWPWW